MVRRNLVTTLEVRSVDNKPSIRGYAAKFNSLSLDLGGFTERISPGAFSRSLADPGNDVLALFGHDYNQPIGRRSAGTLQISEDEQGLCCEIFPDNTTWSQNALEAVRSGNVKGMSFAFDVQTDDWDRKARVRDLKDVNLYEVSLVSLPAYPATEASVTTRNLEEITESFNQSVPPAAISTRSTYHGHRYNYFLHKDRNAK